MIIFVRICFDKLVFKKMADNQTKPVHRRYRVLRIILLSFLGLWAFLLTALQIVLTPSLLSGIVDKIAKEYVDGNVRYGKISASVLKSFPNLNVTIDDFAITYPHEKFAAFDSLGINGVLLKVGRNPAQDTLASFRKFSLSLNYVTLMTGKIQIRNAGIDKPRVFTHYYDSTAANWDIFKFGSDSSDADSTSEESGIPNLVLKKVSLTGQPWIVFTNQTDTVYGTVSLKRLLFNGKIAVRNLKTNRIGLKLDSMLVAGRLPSDTVALFLDGLHIKEQMDKNMAFKASAKTYLGLKGYGRIVIPLDMSGKLDFPKSKYPEIELKDFKADIASIPFNGEGKVILYDDSTFVKAKLGIDACPVSNVIDFAANSFFQGADKIKTEAVINLNAECDGYYSPHTGSIPSLNAVLSIPASKISYKGFDKEGSVKLLAKAYSSKDGKLNADISDSYLRLDGLSLKIDADASDLLADDPVYGVDADASVSLDTLVKALADSSYYVHGGVRANVRGHIRQSQMTLFNFSGADLSGSAKCDSLVIRSFKDTISAFVNKTHVTLGKKADNRLALSALIDSIDVRYKESTFVKGRGLKFTGEDAVHSFSDDGHRTEHPFIGKISALRLGLMGEDSLFVGLMNTSNTFSIAKEKQKSTKVPVLSFSSDNERVFAREGVNRLGFKNVHLSATARMNTFIRTQRKKHFLDSLQRVYPGIQRDSLLHFEMRRRFASRPMPDFLSEKDFEKQDINIRLDESMAKYIREWDLNGKLSVDEGVYITPYFPIKNEFSQITGTFTNDRIDLSNFTLKSGGSDVSASGSLTGLRRALISRGLLKLTLDIKSNKIDANELLIAYKKGSQFVETGSDAALDESVNDSEYLSKVTAAAEDTQTDSTYSMIIVPANLIADVSLQANEIDYSDLEINWLAADLAMKERCMQITNTIATSNMGDIYFEGFYSTKTKSDIKGGFDLNMVDITADKVIQLFPAVDSIMPMLKSFKGNLDCEMAATSALDTNMNFVPNSISGVMQIGGRKLSVDESGAFKKLGKVLMFKNKDVGYIEDMKVNGLIDNSTLEIFPFVLKIDRYVLAMSGKQNFDQSFKYHISVLKSPVPFRFGINLFGNFDDWKYRIGKAKYKNTNVPVFTAEIDTLRRNLVSSIHNIFNKGVELALQENSEAKGKIDKKKADVGFNPDIMTDTLGSRQMKQMDSLSNAYDHPMDSTLSARIDSLSRTATSGNQDSELDSDTTNGKLQKLFDKSMDKRDSAAEKRSARKQEIEKRRQTRKDRRAARKNKLGALSQEAEEKSLSLTERNREARQ